MRRFTWASAAVGAIVGVLAAGVVALPSTPVQALSGACQIGNDTDVAVANIAMLGYGAQSTIALPACQSGKGSRVRVDYRLRNLDPLRPLNVYVTAPDGTTSWLQSSTVPGTADLAATQRWTTSAVSSKGTWSLGVYGNGAGVVIDSWKVWVIPGSCWRVNYDDAHSPAEWGEWKSFSNGAEYYWTYPAVPASTSVSSACTGFASSDMRIRVKLRDVYEHRNDAPYTLRLYRNGVNVPVVEVSTAITADNGDYLTQDVWLSVDGANIRADGTWTLEVTTGGGHHGITGVTMEEWELHTSY